MKLRTTGLLTALAAASASVTVGMCSCSSAPNPGIPGSSANTHPDVPGTVFTIIFENAQAAAYVSSTHPSLPNYIELTSGVTNGIDTNADPRGNVQVPGSDNLADQLDAAGIPWRAYMESMGEPCKLDSSGWYSAHHNPFLYYRSVVTDAARCRAKVVDFDAHFAEDLAKDAYRFVWITPNMCNNLHDCPSEHANAWLEKVVGQIEASPGYQRGGALFILFDEGSTRVFGAAANLATIVLSPKLAKTRFVSQTAYGHPSWLATVQDIFDLPRLPSTRDATPMDEFFVARP